MPGNAIPTTNKPVQRNLVFGSVCTMNFWTPKDGPPQSGYSLSFSIAFLVWMLRLNFDRGRRMQLGSACQERLKTGLLGTTGAGFREAVFGLASY